MAKPFVKYGDFELHRFKEKHVFPFLKNLSAENHREFQELYRIEPLTALLDVLEDDLVHAVMKDDTVLAVCGVSQGVLWTLFSTDIKKHWRTFVRGSPKLINFYHQFYDQLECIVWDENVFIHNWLVHVGFEPQFVSTDENGNTSVSFVRCKNWFDNIDSVASRPVMH